MSDVPTVVLDASVGVKWFRASEAGAGEALRLYERAMDGDIRLAAPAHFIHEVLAVVSRHLTPSAILEAWDLLDASGITILPLTREVAEEAARQCSLLGCSFYDSLAPACASLLDATLATADARAHAAFPRLHLLE